MPKTETKVSWSTHNEVQLSTLAQGYMSAAGSYINWGNQPNTRIGNTILGSGVHIKGAFNNNSTSETFVRMIVLSFRGSNGDPTLNLFQANTTGTVTGVSSVNGLDAIYYPLNKKDLTIYRDKVFRLAGSATGNAGANCKFFNLFVKFGGAKIQYTANTYGYGNQTWQYAVIWIASDANDDTSTGTAVEMSCVERFYFRDP